MTNVALDKFQTSSVGIKNKITTVHFKISDRTSCQILNSVLRISLVFSSTESSLTNMIIDNRACFNSDDNKSPINNIVNPVKKLGKKLKNFCRKVKMILFKISNIFFTPLRYLFRYSFGGVNLLFMNKYFHND